MTEETKETKPDRKTPDPRLEVKMKNEKHKPKPK